jgi:hypothetical protein
MSENGIKISLDCPFKPVGIEPKNTSGFQEKWYNYIGSVFIEAELKQIYKYNKNYEVSEFKKRKWSVI